MLQDEKKMEEQIIEKERDFQFDNFKLFLIMLVIIGHCLEEISIKGNYGIIRTWIYSFHMPAFVFISGYFSKGKENKRKIVQNCLFPYMVFNTLYMIWIQKSFIVNLFYPTYVFWYIWSLFVWRIIINYLFQIKGIMILSILAGCYIGLIQDAGHFMAISRIIVFLPYFVWGGYLIKQ